MARIQFQSKPQYEDYLTVNKAVTFNPPTVVLIIVMGIISAATFLGLILGWLSVESSRLLLYILPPAMFIFFMLYTPVNLRRRARQMANQADEIFWRLSNRGVTIDEGEESLKYKWETFSHVQELPNQYIFFFKANRAAFVFVPKTAFESQDKEEAFRDLLLTQLEIKSQGPR
jgi:hypothetical protein